MNIPTQALLLGTAQDAGVPQAGCPCDRCLRTHADPTQRRLAVALGLVDHSSRQCWLIDATPDFRKQLHQLQYSGDDDAPYPLAGILLTHAHIGHYTGLIHLSREAWSPRDLPLYASRRMGDFLRANAPWSQLIDQRNVELHTLAPGQPLALGAHLRVTPLLVPHRGEWSDTFAFLVQGPQRTLFYCPDIDSWSTWDRDLSALLNEVDVALLDGCFFSADELPGRNIEEIPHPLVTETVSRVAGCRSEVCFIHLNHTNPLHEEGPARDWLRTRGLSVGTRGQRWNL